MEKAEDEAESEPAPKKNDKKEKWDLLYEVSEIVKECKRHKKRDI